MTQTTTELEQLLNEIEEMIKKEKELREEIINRLENSVSGAEKFIVSEEINLIPYNDNI